jgi:lipoprotein-releasing system permease protein
MNKLSLLITWRYLLGARTEKNISIMVLICFLGIFIGAFALALVASIMNGFEKATHQKLRSIHAQIIMRSLGNELDADKISEVLKSEFPEVQSFSPGSYKQIIIQKPGSQEITNAVVLKAIDPAMEEKTSSISDKIIQGTGNTKSLTALVHDDQIVIGKKLAETLGLKIGDPVDLLYISQDQIKSRKITLSKKDVLVSGIFSTGIEEFDSNLVLGSFSLMNNLFDQLGINQFNIQLKPNVSEQETITKLKRRFGLDVFSWKELYPALVAALQLEKYAMFFILALITLVASMNIISLIFMQIIQKRPDIAIFQAMGMHNADIIKLFMLIGIGLSAIAATAGLIAAYIVGLVLEKYPFITLPDTYYVSHLPVQMEWYIFALVLALIICMSILATWIPARNIRSVDAAHVLRFEG